MEKDSYLSKITLVKEVERKQFKDAASNSTGKCGTKRNIWLSPADINALLIHFKLVKKIKD